jgi:hypothetical protein
MSLMKFVLEYKISYLQLSIPVVLMIAPVTLLWLMGFFILLYKDFKARYGWWKLSRMAKKARKEQDRIEKELNKLK